MGLQTENPAYYSFYEAFLHFQARLLHKEYYYLWVHLVRWCVNQSSDAGEDVSHVKAFLCYANANGGSPARAFVAHPW